MTTLKQIRERLIDELQIGFYGTADSVAAQNVTWPLRFQNSNWSTNQFKGWWGHMPQTTGADQVKAMTTIATPGGAVLNQGGSAWTAPVLGTSKYFSLTRPDWHPTIYMLPLVNRALEKCWQWYRTVITPVPDGDMEFADATPWTLVNANAVKDSTGFVWDGTKSLDVTLTGANGYAGCAAFEVAPNRSFRFTVKCRPRVGTAVFKVVDGATAATLVQTQSSQLGMWQDLMVTGTFPATTYRAAVLLGGLSSGDRANWDQASGFWSLMTNTNLPSWVTQWRTEEGEDALRIYYQRNRLGTYDNWSARAYDLGLLDPRDYQILQQPSAFNPLQIEFGRDLTISSWPLIVEARRPFSDFGVLAQDTDITAAPLRLVVAAAKSIAGHERRELNDRLPMWDHDFVREQKRVAGQLQVPAVDEYAGQSWQVWSA